MTTIKMLSAAAAALVLSAGVSMADPAGQASAAKTASAKTVTHASMNKPHHVATVRSEASRACSAQADAQKLHGAPRREFRKSCLSTAAAKAPAAKVQPAAVKAAKPAASGSSTAH